MLSVSWGRKGKDTERAWVRKQGERKRHRDLINEENIAKMHGV